ncbi:MAG: ABC transporter permease [Clostridia bacterium]
MIKANIMGLFGKDYSRKLMLSILGILLGLFFGGVIIFLQGVNPLYAYYYLINGAVGSSQAIISSILKTIPLGIVGLAVIFAYKAGIFNIGGEGQFYLGSIGATIVGTIPLPISQVAHVILCLLAAIIFGGFFAAIPGYLKAYRGFNEIITTMLLNYIAILFTSYLLQGPLREPGTYYNRSSSLQPTALLSPIITGTRLHFGLIIFLVLAIIIYFVFKKSTLGFRLENVGMNKRAAFYAGENTKRLMLLAMCVSGAIAGIAGAVEIMGVNGALVENFVVGIGYDGIAVALLASLNPLGAILSAFFFGALRNGANSMQISIGISSAFVYIIQALAVFFVVLIPGVPRFIRKYKGVK